MLVCVLRLGDLLPSHRPACPWSHQAPQGCQARGLGDSLLLLRVVLQLLLRLGLVVLDASEAFHDRLLGRQHLLQQRHQDWGYWGRGIRDVSRHSVLAAASCRRDAVGER